MTVCGVAAANPEDINCLVNDLQRLGFELTQEGDFSEFLGIKLERRSDGSIYLSQKGLINKILKATQLEECKPNILPASSALGSPGMEVLKVCLGPAAPGEKVMGANTSRGIGHEVVETNSMINSEGPGSSGDIGPMDS